MELANSHREMELGNAESCFLVQQYLLMLLRVSAGIAWGGGSSRHRNAESFRLEKSSEIHSPTPAHPSTLTDHVPRCRVPAALGHPQGWGFPCCPMPEFIALMALMGSPELLCLSSFLCSLMIMAVGLESCNPAAATRCHVCSPASLLFSPH